MPTPNPSSQRKKQVAATRARRWAHAERREDMLEDLAGGVEYAVIARKHGVSLKTVRREVGRGLDKRWIETPERHVRLQVERLTRALRAIDDALLAGDIAAVDPLLKVIEKLDRYHGVGSPAQPPPPRLLAITHAGQELAPGALKSLDADLSLSGREA